MKDWLGKVVDKEDLQRHDKWLCMMWPRLQLLRELLSSKGAIFISIDDDEQGSLRNMCDEIFGPTNFVSNLIWQKKYSPANDATWFSDDHDFIVCYAMDRSTWRPGKIKRTAKQNKAYKNPDNDLRGDWKTGDYTSNKTKDERPNGWYAITNPNTGQEVWPSEDGVWRFVEEEHESNVAEDRVWWGKKGDNRVPAYKRFLTDVDDLVPRTLLLYEDVGHNQDAAREIKLIFGGKAFQTPKPSTLIERLLAVGGDDNALILDSFAGSGTTGHAVLAANARDGGNRRFILIETEDYADTLTAERVRRVIKGVPGARDEALKAGLGGTFTYCELGEAMDTERFFAAEGPPAWGQVARYVVFTATGEALDATDAPGEDGFVAVAGGRRVHLLYRPDLSWLRSSEAALTLDRARALRAAGGDTPILVFGSAQYVSSRTLRELDITFAQLPWSVHQRLAPALTPADPADAADAQP